MASHHMMSSKVIGAGNVSYSWSGGFGGLFGGLLQKGGADVTFLVPGS